MQKILFRHLSGSRREQVDAFPAGDYELIVGRDPAAHVRFDQDRDDLVSRQHVKIIRDPWDANGFQVVDLQSRNGTFLNQQRIFGSTRLSHNDVIQLGAGGPEFRFELDPPPAGSNVPVRETTVALPAAGPGKPTRESWLPGPAGKPNPVGRGTVERMLGDVFTRVKKQSTRWVWLVGIAAVAAVALIGTGTYYVMRRSQTQMKLDLSTAQSQTEAVAAKVQQGVEKSDEAAKEVSQLEAQLEESNRRNDANRQQIAAALDRAKKDAAAQASQLEQARRDQATLRAQLDRLMKQQQSPQSNSTGSSTETPDQAKYDEQRRQAESRVDQDPAGAQEIAEKLIRTDPRRWEGYELLGRIASVRSDFKRAADYYQQALERAPAEAKADLQKKLDAARSLIQP